MSEQSGNPSLATSDSPTPARAPDPGPSASGPLVVLDERDLDEPLEDAIRRIRGETQGARILVIDEAIDPDEEEAAAGPVLRPRQAGPAAADRAGKLAFARAEEAIQRVGARWKHGTEIMGQWVGEAKSLTAELEQALAKNDPSDLAEAVRGLIEITAWMDATIADDRRRAARAAAGMEPVDTAGIARDAARTLHRLQGKIDIQLPALDGARRVPCRARAVFEAFQHALDAVAARIGGRGTIRITIEEGELFVLHRFTGKPGRTGEAGGPEGLGAPPGFAADRLRHLVVGIHRGRIFRGRGAQAGSELVIALPKDDAVAGLDPVSRA